VLLGHVRPAAMTTVLPCATLLVAGPLRNSTTTRTCSNLIGTLVDLYERVISHG
jgi:hypothetical protein